jgi:hypothetical protein
MAGSARRCFSVRNGIFVYPTARRGNESQILLEEYNEKHQEPSMDWTGALIYVSEVGSFLAIMGLVIKLAKFGR